MANTVSLLSYANTFGDWVVATNALTKENNDLAANNYTKPSGTLFLNDSTLGLQVDKGAIFAGPLQVTGVGSSAYVQNTLKVDGVSTLANANVAVLSITNLSYAGNTLLLNANAPSGTNTSIVIKRGSSQNAAIRWNEGGKYFDLYDPTLTTYYKVLTTGTMSDSIVSTSPTTAASSNAVNILNNALTSAVNYIAGVDNAQNTSISVIAAAYTQANVANYAYTVANAAYASSNTKIASITGTPNQIIVTSGTTPTLNLPQSIAVTSAVQFGSIGVGVQNNSSNGSIYATGPIVSVSDESVKTNVQTIQNALSLVQAMRGVSYDRIDTGRHEIGLIAQELQQVLPEMVVNNDGLLAIWYSNIVAVLIEAIKELKAEVDALKSNNP